MDLPDDSFERDAERAGHARIVGIDEAGRGPLAGPVVAAAVVLDLARVPGGLNDSKALSRTRREALMSELRCCAEIGIGIADVSEIDALNILRATHLAMTRAVGDLGHAPDIALIDGNSVPASLPCPAHGIVKGDARCLSIAAASIVAKCTRDTIMVALSQQHPGYGWETNMGYPSKAHKHAIRDLGISPHHRRSFAPIHNILYQEKT